jgi:hypothetical protein
MVDDEAAHKRTDDGNFKSFKFRWNITDSSLINSSTPILTFPLKGEETRGRNLYRSYF